MTAEPLTYLLFIDTEASGLPKKWNVPYSTEKNWPYCVQIAWVIYTSDGSEVKYENHYVKDDDFKIKSSAIKVHGITRNYLNSEGESREEILTLLSNNLQKYKPLVAGHFMELDFHVLSADYYRCGMINPLEHVHLFCTMLATKRHLANDQVKYLKLAELYKLLFNEKLQQSHNAIADARATAKCFFELMKIGTIDEDAIRNQQPVKPFAKPGKQYGCSMLFFSGVLFTVIILYLL